MPRQMTSDEKYARAIRVEVSQQVTMEITKAIYKTVATHGEDPELAIIVATGFVGVLQSMLSLDSMRPVGLAIIHAIKDLEKPSA